MKNVLDKFRLEGKVVIITGGAGLLGSIHAEAVAEAGGIPIIWDRRGQAARQTAKQIADRFKAGALGMKVDITREGEIKRACTAVLKWAGRIDVLINNAACDPKVKPGQGKASGRLEDFSPRQWHQEVAVGLTGAFLCSRVLGQVMAKRKSGVILNISSDLGLIAPDQRIYERKGLKAGRQSKKPVTYSVIKHGLIGLTRYLATYWAGAGIRVNALCPGGVFNDQPREFVKRLTQLIPMGRMARKDEYKAAVLFLISDASAYMTGSVISVDGGRTCW